MAWRRQLFNLTQATGCPIPLRALKKARRTKWIGAKGQTEDTEREERLSWWRGITEFSVDSHFLVNSTKQNAGPKKKRGEGEVFPHEIPAEEWPE